MIAAPQDELMERGFVQLPRAYASVAEAWDAARAVLDRCTGVDPIGHGLPELTPVGEYTIPSPEAAHRAFQILHLDFGLPVASRAPLDVARFTALYIDSRRAPTTARTRIVSLPRFLGQRPWPVPDQLHARLRAYGARQVGDGDYVEGVLARLVEAADDTPQLPAVTAPGFLCGLEFNTRAEEAAHLRERGLELDADETQIQLKPGELLIFDNLTTAHGRVGRRRPHELSQLCLGYHQLATEHQQLLCERVLASFSATETTAYHEGETRA